MLLLDYLYKFNKFNGFSRLLPLMRNVGLPCSVVFTLWTNVVYANINGSDTQNFNSTNSGKDFVTVYSSQTLGTGRFSLGLFLNHAINTLPYFDDAIGESNDEDKKYNDGLTAAELHASVGVLPYLDLGVTLPSVIYQDVKNEEEYHGQFKKKGISGLKLSAKLNMWHNDTTGLAFVLVAHVDQIVKNPFAGSKSSPGVNAEIIADKKIDDFTLGVNAGYRIKNPGETYTTDRGSDPIVPVEDEITGSFAVQYHIPNTNTQILGEIYGAKPMDDFSEVSPRSSSILEFIGGVRHYINPDLQLHGGAGTELMHGLSTPDFRIYAGLHWMPQGQPLKEEPRKPAPAPMPPVAKEDPDRVYIIKDILFKFNSNQVDHATAQKQLKAVSEAITPISNLDKLIIEGHTCAIGANTYNRKLSLFRANAIKEWLIKHHHVPASKIIVRGYGEDSPMTTNKTVSGRKLNRRVEFKVFYANKKKINSNTLTKK
jgi:outer membrane protein OmpA-like peptidoglycan-associated protein